MPWTGQARLSLLPDAHLSVLFFNTQVIVITSVCLVDDLKKYTKSLYEKIGFLSHFLVSILSWTAALQPGSEPAKTTKSLKLNFLLMEPIF